MGIGETSSGRHAAGVDTFMAAGGTHRAPLTKIDKSSTKDGRGAASVEAADARLSTDLGEGVKKAGVARLVEFARSDETTIALHAHLDEIARNSNRLTNTTGSHTSCHLGEKRRLILWRITTEKTTNVLVADSTEASVGNVTCDSRRDARVEAHHALILDDVHHHAPESILCAHEVGLSL
eukprot:scaffold130984_cov33-Tisochrysis_lutea.AAC.3